MTNVYIDHNMWDFLYKNSIEICSFFPSPKYSVLITKHGKFEIDQTPSTERTIDLIKFINHNLVVCVNERHIFGFHNPELSNEEQRSSGFGVGCFTTTIENTERKRLSDIYSKKDKRKSSMILFKEEADIELGAISVENHVLTFDQKQGPLRSAYENGGNVIFMNELRCTSAIEMMEKAVSIIENKI